MELEEVKVKDIFYYPELYQDIYDDSNNSNNKILYFKKTCEDPTFENYIIELNILNDKLNINLKNGDDTINYQSELTLKGLLKKDKELSKTNKSLNDYFDTLKKMLTSNEYTLTSSQNKIIFQSKEIIKFKLNLNKKNLTSNSPSKSSPSKNRKSVSSINTNINTRSKQEHESKENTDLYELVRSLYAKVNLIQQENVDLKAQIESLEKSKDDLELRLAKKSRQISFLAKKFKRSQSNNSVQPNISLNNTPQLSSNNNQRELKIIQIKSNEISSNENIINNSISMSPTNINNLNSINSNNNQIQTSNINLINSEPPSSYPIPQLPISNAPSQNVNPISYINTDEPTQNNPNTSVEKSPIKSLTKKIKSLDSKVTSIYSLLSVCSKVDVNHITSMRTLTNHGNDVTNIILLNDGRLASCSGDKSIIIYNSTTYNCDIIIYNAHTEFIYTICQLQNSNLASGSMEEIKIWKLHPNHYELVHTINRAHDLMINKIITVFTDLFASCSNDQKIRIWKTENYEKMADLEGHGDFVMSIYMLKNGNMVSGSWRDNTLRFWDLCFYKELNRIENIHSTCGYNSLLEINDGKLIVGEQFQIKIVNTKTYQVETYINTTMRGIFSFTMLEDGNVLCGSSKGDIIYLRIKKGLYATENWGNIHSKGINSLLNIGNGTIISSSFDQNIKIMKYKI